uniref:tRNA (N6-threonylcarbamoyladenosine(37)-N6)-methyltransferase TrmO n=1 Tax=Desulfatirhabdium butyrativorans TaxID=340467 RepID=A0A7C4RUE1_9BACT
MIHQPFQLQAIGIIHHPGKDPWIEIDPQYAEGLQGLSAYSHIHVLFWFHENDVPEKRAILKVHPCRNPANPLTGVFATHSPMRPNLIGLTLCRIRRIEGCIIHIEDIDARDGTPLLDIKGYFPYEIAPPLQYPKWDRSRKEDSQR